MAGDTELHDRRESAHGRSQINDQDPQGMRRGKGKRRCCSVGETFLFGGVCKITGQGVISGPEREPPVRAARHPGTGPLEIRGAKLLRRATVDLRSLSH